MSTESQTERPTITAALAQVGKLLPCPMCGSEAQSRKEREKLPDGSWDTLYHVACDNPRCRTRSNSWYPARAAIAAWNTRPDLSSILEGLKTMEIELRAVQTGNSAGVMDRPCSASGHPYSVRFESSAAPQPAEPVDVEGLVAKIAAIPPPYTGFDSCVRRDEAIAIIRQHFGQQIKEGDHD